jgi:hypothetical protein
MRRLLLLSCVFVGMALVVLGAEPALANSNCPTSTAGALTAPNVTASFTGNGNTATYTFQSLANESPSGGIPGLIGYCVYPGTLPDSTTASAVGANGTAWGSGLDAPAFFFTRPDGDPSNVPLDGTMTTIGTATWSSGIPGGQTIVLHINDPGVCGSLYQEGTLTCYARPSTAGNDVPAGTIGELGLTALLGLALLGSLAVWRRSRHGPDGMGKRSQ